MSFVPAEFELPESLETGRFRLRMLTVNDVVKDFDAVSTSIAHLQEVWRTRWPDGLTLEQNLVDLGWHQKEFQRRSSFAYTVVAPDESRVLGCVYIYPSRKRRFEAEVYLWVRQSELESGLDTELEQSVRAWLDRDWPFSTIAFPGRDPAWSEWDELEEESP